MQNLHYASKDSEPRLKIDVRVECRLATEAIIQEQKFDGMDGDELTVEQIVHGPPEYSQWENRN